MDDDGEYIRGFNGGYRIQKEAPEILERMLEGMHKETFYKKGLRDGGKQYKKELAMAHIKARTEKAKNNDRDKGNSNKR